MVGMRWSSRFARFVAIGVVAVVSACSGGSAKPNLSTASGATGSSGSVVSSPTVSPSPSLSVPAIPADVPRTGHNVKPGEQPPVYPVAALAKTQAGANAFAKFFMQTLDWAYATTNPSYMKHYYGPTCGLCASLATGIAKTATVHEVFEGGRITVRQTASSTRDGITAPADYCTTIRVRITAQTVVDSSGAIKNGAGAESNLGWKLCEQSIPSNGWLVSYFAATS